MGRTVKVCDKREIKEKETSACVCVVCIPPIETLCQYSLLQLRIVVIKTRVQQQIHTLVYIL